MINFWHCSPDIDEPDAGPRSDPADSVNWHPHAPLMFVQTGPQQLGVAVDSALRSADVRCLLQLLAHFRHSAEQLFVDSPVIDLFMAQINREQLSALLEQLRRGGRPRSDSLFRPCLDKGLSVPTSWTVPAGPFFPHLTKLTVTSTVSAGF